MLHIFRLTMMFNTTSNVRMAEVQLSTIDMKQNEKQNKMKSWFDDSWRKTIIQLTFSCAECFNRMWSEWAVQCLTLLYFRLACVYYYLLIESKSNMQPIQSDHADDINMNEMLFEMLKCLPLTLISHLPSY